MTDKTKAQPLTGAEARDTLRLLAAEDNAVHQLLLKSLLHHVGLELTLVENGRMAVEAWQDGDWDLILMDLAMPEMGGAAAVREIRSLEASTGRPRTSIIAVTADIMAQHVAECLGAGMDAHVAKPIMPSMLYEAIGTALADAEDKGEVEQGAARGA
jgi:two-component system, sensor histidine kinase